MARLRQFKQVTPEFGVADVRSRPGQALEPLSRAMGTSPGWSGSVLAQPQWTPQDHFTQISGAFTVPNVYETPGKGDQVQECYVWLGIDGWNPPKDQPQLNQVQQAGTATRPDGSCFAWFEWFPAGPVGIPFFGVSPGDVVDVTLTVADTQAKLIMANLTTGFITDTIPFSAPSGYSSTGSYAEAIVERPGDPPKVLPRYGAVFFDDVSDDQVAHAPAASRLPTGPAWLRHFRNNLTDTHDVAHADCVFIASGKHQVLPERSRPHSRETQFRSPGWVVLNWINEECLLWAAVVAVVGVLVSSYAVDPNLRCPNNG